MYISHFVISSSADTHLDCFHFLAFMKNFAVSIRMQILCGKVQDFVFFKFSPV